MENKLKVIIYNAARHGRVELMRTILDNEPRPYARSLVSSIVLRSTPLIEACCKGFSDVIKYLIEEYDADIELAGSASFKGKVINATPLWFAAATGHLDVVKLISHKALVNAKTESTSTPLVAACLYGHYEIVKCLIENEADLEAVDSEGSTSLIIACSLGHYEIASYLLHCGADKNAKNLVSNTALHVCAEYDRYDIIQMLLDHGAEMQVNNFGFTPLLLAAMKRRVTVVECFIKNKSCNLAEGIDAYKLLGASYVDDVLGMPMAYSCWKKALKLLNQDASSLISKALSVPPVEAYNDETEMNTYEELEEMKSNTERMKFQALIIRERILGPGNPCTLTHIYHQGLWYSKNGNINCCIQLWVHKLILQQKVMEPLHWKIRNNLFNIVDCMYQFVSKSIYEDRHLIPTCFYSIQVLLYHTTKMIESAMPCNIEDMEYFDFVLKIALHVIGMFIKLMHYLLSDDKVQVMRAINYLVRLDPKSNFNESLLHISCSKVTAIFGYSSEVMFPSVEVAELLLKVGAYPNARDDRGNTPLHKIALDVLLNYSLFNLLLDNGAHLDFRNKDRKSILDLLSPEDTIHIFPLHHLNLKCISAKVVRDAKISFHGLVPANVEDFLNNH